MGGFANRGVLNYEAGHFEESRADLDRAIEWVPDHASCTRTVQLSSSISVDIRKPRWISKLLQLDPNVKQRAELRDGVISIL